MYVEGGFSLPDFKYTAKASDGRIEKGVITAGDQEKFFAEIKSQNLYLLKYDKLDKQEGSMVLGQKKQLKLKDLTVFCRQTASLLRVGVSLVKAIDILYQQTTSKVMKASIQKIYESVQKGSLLSESLRAQPGKYPGIMISLIESGEASGMLAESVDKIATQFENDLYLKRKITSSMVYPAVLVVIGIAVVILLVTVVLPQFIKMFEQAGLSELPVTTRVILGLSAFVTTKWYFLLFGILILVIIIRLYLKSENGRLAWDRAKLQLPVFKPILSALIVVRFCRTMATLLSSGIPMLQSLGIVMNVVNNKAVSTELAESSEDIRKGQTLANSIRRVTVFPPMVQSMISIGEESGSLDQMLENSADYFNDELQNRITRAVTLIEPAMIVVLGGVVAFIILSIMQPMLQIYNSIG